MPDQQQMMKRQQVLAEFGDLALRSRDLDEVLTEACRLVGEALGTDRAKVLEIQEGGDELLVRAGVGWPPNVVGQVRLPMKERSSETYSIREGKPVISKNIAEEDRFDIPQFMKDAGVVALANVPIFVPGMEPYGLLQVDAAEPREFGHEDIEFLRTYTTILGPVIDRLRKLQILRTSEERFRLIVETVKDYAIFTTDPHDTINDWFPGAEAVFGWTAEEAVGQPSAMTFTPEDRETGQDEKEAAIARQEGSAANVRWHIRKDGSRVFIEGAVRALRDPAGGLQGFVKIGRDITERAHAEKRLRRNEERLAAIFAHASVGLSEVDRSGRFKRVNAELCRILGRSQEDLLRAGIGEVTFEDDLLPSVDALTRAVQTGQLASLDKRYKRPDGSLVWANSSLTRLTDENEAETLLVVTIDLTERRAAEAARRESEARLAAAFESVPVGIAVIDMAGRIVSCNPEYGRYLPSGVIPSSSPEEASRWRGWDAHGQLIDIHDYPGARAMRGERVVPGLDMLFTDDDGREIWTNVSTVPIRDASGQLTGQASVISDIDTLKRVAEALRESEARQRALIEGLPQLVWRARNAGAWTWASPQWTAYTGQTWEESRDWGWLDAVHPEDRDTARDAWTRAPEQGHLEAEYRIHTHQCGTYRWFKTRAAALRNEAGQFIEWLGTSTDIHDARTLQERQRVLVAELQHRTFNLMGLVRATADATIRSSASLDEFKPKFRDRIAALARVQRLLSRLKDDDRVTFDELIRSELDAVGALQPGDNRVTLSGPDGVALRSSSVQTFAMALHELATNARKYGALNQPGAHLDVRWRMEIGEDGEPWLHLNWMETGVAMPPANAAPQGTGQGRALIEEALPYQLKARTTYVMAPDGVRCSIALPVSARMLVEADDADQ